MTETTTSTAVTASATRAQGPHYSFLDGVRGIASLMVVVSHLTLWGPIPPFLLALGMGNPWVAIFIVLSGFVLYLPAAGRDAIELPRPFLDFMKRRARRLLPAWYGSLVLCTVVGLLLRTGGSPDAHYLIPQDGFDVVTHLTLLHSLTRYSGSINGPGYTLGIEWQLYLLMTPFLWVARRRGWLFLVLLMLSFGIASFAAPIAGKTIGRIAPAAFTLPFILGMLAARLTHCPPPFLDTACGLWLLRAGVVFGAIGFWILKSWNHSVACWGVGLAMACGCCLMARAPQGIAARLLARAPVVWLGGISYSLYLVHAPLIIACGWLCRRWGLTGNTGAYLFALLGIPLIAGFAWAFYRVLERPFLQVRTQTTTAITLVTPGVG